MAEVRASLGRMLALNKPRQGTSTGSYPYQTMLRTPKLPIPPRSFRRYRHQRVPMRIGWEITQGLALARFREDLGERRGAECFFDEGQGVIDSLVQWAQPH